MTTKQPLVADEANARAPYTAIFTDDFCWQFAALCVCVCVFAAVCLSTYFIKREAAFMCYRFVTNIQCHSTLQTTPGHAPTLLNTHASALVPHPHLVCLL